MAATRPPWRAASSAAMSRILRAMDSSCMRLPRDRSLHVLDLEIPPQLRAELIERPGDQADRDQPPDQPGRGRRPPVIVRRTEQGTAPPGFELQHVAIPF